MGAWTSLCSCTTRLQLLCVCVVGVTKEGRGKGKAWAEPQKPGLAVGGDGEHPWKPYVTRGSCGYRSRVSMCPQQAFSWEDRGPVSWVSAGLGAHPPHVAGEEVKAQECSLTQEGASGSVGRAPVCDHFPPCPSRGWCWPSGVPSQVFRKRRDVGDTLRHSPTVSFLASGKPSSVDLPYLIIPD